MKAKHIITIATCLLFGLSSFAAMAGERVYIRLYDQYSTGIIRVAVWEKGFSTETLLPAPNKDHPKTLEQFAPVLEKYFTQGYKMLGETSFYNGTIAYTEYIFEKP